MNETELKKMKKFDIQYTDDMIDAIDLISNNNEHVSPFGSFIFSNLPYAGDIDLQEKCNTEQEIPVIMQNVLKKILSDKAYNSTYILGDIKMGRKKYLEECHNSIGYLKDNQIHNFKPEVFEIYSKKYKDLDFKIPKDMKGWLKLHKDLHKAETIRWTPKEFIKGYKLENKEKITLNDALQNSELNKIDMYYFSEAKGKFIEITNVFYYNEKDNKEHMIYEIALNGLEYLLLEPQNVMKYVKRYYSYLRQLKNYSLMEKIAPFLQGNINFLNSCITDLSLLENLQDFNYPINNKLNRLLVHFHIDNIIARLQNIFEVNISDEIFLDLKKLLDYDNWNSITKIVKVVVEHLRDIVNKETIKFLNKNNIPILKL